MRVTKRANGYALSRDLAPTLVGIDDLKPLGNETRKHSYEQVRKLAKSIDEFGFVLPILIDAENRVVAGWGMVQAARKLQLSGVPAIKLANLSEAQLRALRLALNRLGEESSWIPNALRLEFTEILKLDANLDLEVSGFDMGEIDMTLSSVTADSDEEPAQSLPQPARVNLSREIYGA